jgi:hypothetical protein
MVGEEDVGFEAEDRLEDRREGAVDERNHLRDSSDQDVLLGEAFR